jgi:hypothetical protein
MMAAGAGLIAAACLLALAARDAAGGATAALMPLVADLAPEGLRGRYMAAVGLSWWIGLALAPTLETRLLSVSATLAFGASAGVAAAAAVAMLRLDRRLPAGARFTPRPGAVAARK